MQVLMINYTPASLVVNS